MCDIDKLIPADDIQIVEISDETIQRHIEAFGKFICNVTSQDVYVTACCSTVLLPSCSTFLMSDISKVHLLSEFSALKRLDYNLIVIDPPWENRSAIRGRKYKWLNKDDICLLPVNQLLAPGGIVAIWVTNKRQLVQWVVDCLLPHWDIQYIAEWTWIKVTTTGELVFDIESSHKKPYENIIIGKSRKDSCLEEPTRTDITDNEIEDQPPCKVIKYEDSCSTDEVEHVIVKCNNSTNQIPSHYNFLCVPSTTHSQKPYLGDLLYNYITGDLRGLELFARNLLPNWTSWGNEVLRFQEVSCNLS